MQAITLSKDSENREKSGETKSISNGMGCVGAYGMGNLHICEGTINAERHIQVLEQRMLLSR